MESLKIYILISIYFVHNVIWKYNSKQVKKAREPPVAHPRSNDKMAVTLILNHSV